MVQTPILLIDEIEDDTNQYVKFNEATRNLEASVNAELIVDLTSGNETVTNLTPDYEMLRYGIFRAQNNTVARSITFSANIRIFQVFNDGTFALDVIIGATTLSIPVGEIHRYYADGSVNGLIKID